MPAIMPVRDRSLFFAVAVLCAAAAIFDFAGCTKRSAAQASPTDLQLAVSTPFRFVAYGDSRFHDPKDTEAANPAVRTALVRAIADLEPAFICFTGDIVYNGYDRNDWETWDQDTSVWREKKIPVLPALGNHDLYGDEKVALGNYFQRFPALKSSRYYAARAGNVLVLALDSSQDEVSGAQGEWLNGQFDHVPAGVNFVFVLLHHPPYTSASPEILGHGHSARAREQSLARMLEDRQARAKFRVVVFSGHVHNYERHEHGGVTYFVTGGAGAHAYPIRRAADDPFKSKEVNYHYLLVEVDQLRLKITMNRLDLTNGKAAWTQPDSVTIDVPAAAASHAAGQ